MRKLQNAQGVSIMEVAEGDTGWSVVTDSPFNRRITHRTPMRIAGPAAGHELLRTDADPDGTRVLGTLNNCGSGRTPWGTYLTCEENFNGYFGATDAEAVLPDAFARYGIGAESRYAYERFDERFDLSKHPNEPNRFGYIVEIDPADASSTPVKRTALGRFKHENAACVLARDGRVVVYMGDDERGEYLYKYVSRRPYVPGGDTDTLLDDGQLFAARFDDDTSGRWLALTPEATGHGRRRDPDPHPHGRLRRRRHDDGPSRVGRGEPGGRRGLLRADQQQATAASCRTPAATRRRWAGRTRARPTSSVRSCAGTPPTTTTRARRSSGTCT